MLFSAVVFIALGFMLKDYRVDGNYLAFLGIRSASYSAGDYFPLLPNFGYFLVGVFIGRTAYKNKKTLMPFVKDTNPIVRIFGFLGRQSLWVYMIHQPLAYGVLYLIFEIIKK